MFSRLRVAPPAVLEQCDYVSMSTTSQREYFLTKIYRHKPSAISLLTFVRCTERIAWQFSPLMHRGAMRRVRGEEFSRGKEKKESRPNGLLDSNNATRFEHYAFSPRVFLRKHRPWCGAHEVCLRRGSCVRVRQGEPKQKARGDCLGLVLAPPAGLEPATPWLTVRCSTDWAKEEYTLRLTL